MSPGLVSSPYENLRPQCFNRFVSCWNARTRHTVPLNVSYCPPANVNLFSDAQPADSYVSQESATQACLRLYHAGKETELVMRFQVPDPTLWVQRAVMTGSSSNLARAHQPLLQSGIFRAGWWPYRVLPFAVQVTDKSAILDISEGQHPVVLSSSMHQRVGWRDYAERKVRTWLCSGLPRLCNTRAVCTIIMNQSNRPQIVGSLRVEPLCGTKCHVPNSCSSSQLVLRTWMLPSLASPVWRRCELNAGYRSISLVGFRARRCSFSGTVAESCVWYSRRCLDSLPRTVGSEFHLLRLAKFEAKPFCSSQRNLYCGPKLFLAGSGMPAGRIWTWLLLFAHCIARTILFENCPSLMVSAPPLLCRRRQRYERAETCPVFKINESRL